MMSWIDRLMLEVGEQVSKKLIRMSGDKSVPQGTSDDTSVKTVIPVNEQRGLDGE